ncbi:unnamed protein product [Vitrella brassicaformis CCMP3155]|uniref:FAD-binding domain-containing protein n=1 Tax=Vitrella brassicaformis (strain CCMP3155) TaxID=1169540 RepID=A0A0G4FWG0_VITBC|nr:unnamed protein product [Vitrella brassicaformis CCMP3155]|eukprot:CEM19553.1 unnamed protein product [Vitrella brassicaformis CCMP3155]
MTYSLLPLLVAAAHTPLGAVGELRYDPVVVAGGGPAGLSTAIMLAKRGYRDITVLEQRSASAYMNDTSDPSHMLTLFPRAQRVLSSLGVLVAVRASCLPNALHNVTVVTPKRVRSVLIKEHERRRGDNHSSSSSTSSHSPSVWFISWNQLTKALCEHIDARWSDSIRVATDSRVINVERCDEQGSDMVDVTVRESAADGGSEVYTMSARLVVGADGGESRVADVMARMDPMCRRVTLGRPSSCNGVKNMRYKTFSLPSDLPLSSSQPPLPAGTPLTLSSSSFRLHVYPSPKNESRVGMAIVHRSHPLLRMRRGRDVLKYLQKAFPNVPIRSVVSRDEADRFAARKEHTFPSNSYIDHRVYHDSQMVLVGDAMHSMCADLRQGVSCALQDVELLEWAIDRCDDDLTEALALYDKMRANEAKAIVWLSYLYPVASGLTPLIRRNLWLLDFRIQSFLHKVLPRVFAPPPFVYVGRADVPYSTILQRCMSTTRTIHTMETLAVGLCVGFGVYQYMRTVQGKASRLE